MGQRRFRRVATAMLAFCCLGAGVTAALAVDPPQPDFFWPYGQVQLDGANLEPEVQPVIAIVNGRACGEAETRVVEAGEGVPPADVGKTVYVVDVLADGSNEGQRVGCGRPGDAVTLYFPASHRFATGQLQFVVGSLRADVELGAALANRLPLPMLAGDSAE
jgi:hypothetical protein